MNNLEIQARENLIIVWAFWEMFDIQYRENEHAI